MGKPQTENNRSLESWNLSCPKISLRNPLFNVEPVEIGTARSESFTSYIARQAKAHSVTTGALFTYELAPRANKPYLLRQSKKGQSVLTTTFYAGTPALNGIGSTARDWVRVVEDLNGRRDLHYLTMLTWTNVLVEKLFSRPVRAWCWECLEERDAFGLQPYEHLLWMQKMVKVCPFHKRVLETLCPSCRRDMRPLGDRTVPGFCARCGAWLGRQSTRNQVAPRLDGLDLKYEEWLAIQIGELIAAAPNLSFEPTKEMVRESLFAFIDRTSGGNRGGFAREFDVNTTTVQSWGRSRPLPQTDLILKICYKMSVSLLDFFVTKNYLADEDWQCRAEVIKTRAARRYERRDPEKVKSALLAALTEKRPRSVAEVAKDLGYMTTAGIYKLFPGICKRLQDRYRRSGSKASIDQRFTIDDETVRRVLVEALEQECPPSIYVLTRDLGYKDSKHLIDRFPDLCDSIKDRRDKWKRARKRSIRKTLKSALVEVPPPSITNVGNRLGYNNGITIGVYFPELCAQISARYARHLVSQRDGMRKQLQAALTERIPPTLREVANRVGHDRSYLRTQFRALCRMVTKRRNRYVKQLSTARARKAKKRIRLAAKRLYSDGTYPSMRRVRASLSGEVTFDTRELSDVLREVRQELGLPHRLGMSR
jgi:AraC-like DNA-binding protein